MNSSVLTPSLTQGEGRFSGQNLIRTALVFVLAFTVYAVMAGDLLTEQSVAPHFVYLADAFLRGETHLSDPLPSTYDLIRYEDKWYVAQQPLPALLMLPVAVIRDAAAIPDIFITVFLGAVSVALCDFTIGIFVPELNPWRRSLLTLFYALGTAHSTLSIMGTVWFMGQVAGTLFLWPFLLGLEWRWPVLAGLSLGLVALARPSIVPGALLLITGWIRFRGTDSIYTVPTGIASVETPRNVIVSATSPLKRGIRDLMLFSIPFLLCIGFLGWYNATRFGSPADFGYDYIVEAEVLAARRLEHGNFSFYFFPENLYTATIRPPSFENGNIEPDPWGMGLLLTSPVLVYGFFAWDSAGKGLKPPVPDQNLAIFSHHQKILMAVSAIVILLPSLLYHNTGSIQFGYRFVLDALPPLMILTAWGARKRAIWLLAIGTIYSVAIHLWGIHWLYPLIMGRGWII